MSRSGPKITYNIIEMFQLRIRGWTTISLGYRYHKDHSTIVHHCQKYGIFPGLPQDFPLPQIEFEIKVDPREQELSKPYKYASLFNEGPVNPGKTYKEYIYDLKKRREYTLYKHYLAITPKDTSHFGADHHI